MDERHFFLHLELVQKLFFNRFQGIKEDEFFGKLTRLQQVENIDKFSHKWESSSGWVFGLYDKQRLETYFRGLKSYLQKELKLHNIPNVEVARHKAKAAKCKLEGIKTRGDNHYQQEKETQYRYYANTWSTDHQCHKPQSYSYEMENISKSSNSYVDNRKKKKNICRQCGDDWTPGHKRRNNQIIKCIITNGEEVQVSAPEISSDSNTDTDSEWRMILGNTQALRTKLP